MKDRESKEKWARIIERMKSVYDLIKEGNEVSEVIYVDFESKTVVGRIKDIDFNKKVA